MYAGRAILGRVCMGIINMIQTMKLVHKLDIVLVKIGNFHQVYGKDAYIISYLFGYKLKKIEKRI